MADYLPASQSDLCTWMNNFSTIVAAAPGESGLTAGDAAAITQVVESFVAAVALTREPASRTAITLHLKKRARQKMLEVVRRYARQIKNSTAVSEARKVQLQLRPRGVSRASMPVPSVRPVLSIIGVETCRHVLYLGDLEKSDGGARPADVAGAQILCYVGDTPPADPLDARFVRFTTRNRHTVTHKTEAIGQKAHYFARWQNTTGETGPWSQVASMTVAG